MSWVTLERAAQPLFVQRPVDVLGQDLQKLGKPECGVGVSKKNVFSRLSDPIHGCLGIRFDGRTCNLRINTGRLHVLRGRSRRHPPR